MTDKCYDEIWPCGPRFVKSDKSFKMTTDSVLLSYFADTKGALLGCDLGCGGGAVSVLMCHSNPRLTIHGVELDIGAVEEARENAHINYMNDKLKIYHQDLRDDVLGAGRYDIVVTNPPYFSQDSGREHASFASSRDERSCTLSDVCSAAARLLRWGGKMYMVHRPERLSEIFCTMTSNTIEPKRLMLVHASAESEPSLILIEGRRGGKPGLRIEKPLIMRNPDGTESDIIKEIYHIK